MGSKKFLFVGGCGRSGTTLVQKLLIAHKSINGGPEFSYTKPIFELYRRMEESIESEYISNYASTESLKESFNQLYKSFFVSYKDEDITYFSEKPLQIFLLSKKF